MANKNFYQNKKVLVTGASGLIGANLVEELLKLGAKVRGTLHKKSPVIKDEHVEYKHYDLNRKEDCFAAVDGMDFVFHTAANSSGAAVMKNNPIVHVTENLIINARMLEAAHERKVERFLFTSTTTVYPPSEKPVKESQAYDGDPYPSYFGVGWMKRYIEKLAQFYHQQFNMKISLVRPTNVYGPYDKFDFERSHVLPALIRRAVEKQDPYEVWGDGSAIRDFIYVSDMTEIFLRALELAADCRPVNFGSGRPVTVKESVDLILKLTGHDVAPVYDPTKPTTIPVRLVDLSYCKEKLGYEAQISLEEGLKKTIAWYHSTLKN